MLNQYDNANTMLTLLKSGNSGFGNYNSGLNSWFLRSLGGFGGFGGGFGGSEAGDAGDIIEKQQANQRKNMFRGGSFGNSWGSSGYYPLLDPHGDY